MKVFIIGVLASIIGGAILWFLQSQGFLYRGWIWFWGSLIWIWERLLWSYPMPLWAILLGALFLLLAPITLKSLSKRLTQPNHEQNITYLSYVEDTIDGVKWRWRWNSNQSIVGLQSFCHICDSQLQVFSYSFVGPTKLICERCPSQGSNGLNMSERQQLALREGRGRLVSTISGTPNQVQNATEREVFRRARSGEWRTSKAT